MQFARFRFQFENKRYSILSKQTTLKAGLLTSTQLLNGSTLTQLLIQPTMSSIVFRTPLSQEESVLYSNHFKSLDKENLGVVTGEAVRPLFAASGLSPQVLGQIWALVDINNKGFLNEMEFDAALRSISHLQAAPTTPINNQLYQYAPAQLPQLGPVPAETPQPAVLPSPSSSDVSQFAQLFDRSANGQNVLSGDAAKDIFLKAKLPNQTLGEVWALCDRNANGLLDKAEFIMAMHLIQLIRNNNPAMTHLLSQHQPIPAHVWSSIATSLQNGTTMSSSSPMNNNSNNNNVNMVPLQQTTGQQLSNNSTGMSASQSPVGRTPTISRLSSGVFNNASHDWTLSPEKKKQFDVIYDSLDKQKIGSLTSQTLVPFFLSSKLNQETLASIWDLADIHNNASFTKTEFAIAMFLIQKKNNGVELPDVIPNELLQSPALGLYPQQQQPAATIPSRATKPSFQDTTTTTQPQIPVQNSNNGSLNDLMALNGSFNSPSSSTGVLRNDTNNSFNQTATSPGMQPHHLKKFTPTSNFGQNIIKEESDTVSPLPQIPQHQVKQTPPPPPVQRTASVSLPNVPNFANSLSMHSTGNNNNFGVGAAVGAAAGLAAGAIGSAATSTNNAFHNNDLYADAGASAQLSAATTDLANLSNQVTSLSKQSSTSNEKKNRASKELQRVTEMKKSIEAKLITLRSNHEQNLKQADVLETQLLSVNKEKDAFQNELNLVEANFHAIQSKLNELTTSLENAQNENVQLKEKIASFNNQTTVLNQQLQEKQQQVKQERSLADVNSKQLEMSEITVTNLQKEIAGLGESLALYLTKQKELNDYKESVEKQHTELQTRYEELANTETDLNNRQLQLDERNKQIEEQEKLYSEHVAQLQSMFDDLAKRKESFDKADQDLKRQNIEYANHVQELTERQMQLAMGEIPEDSDDIVSKFATNNTKAVDTNDKEMTHEEEVSKYVDSTVEDSQLNVVNKQVTPAHIEDDDEDNKTEKAESDVFDKDVPTEVSQSEAGETNSNMNNNDAISDRFEGSLDDYGIPRTQSFTSSVANNAPQSVRDDVELPPSAALESAGTVTSSANVSKSVTPDQTVIASQGNETETTEEAGTEHIPGEWTSDSASQTAPVATEKELVGHSESESSIAKSPQPDIADQESNEQDNSQFENAIDAVSIPEDKQKNTHPINEEFPPIQELEINESDSSASEDEFQDTKEAITPLVSSASEPQERAIINPPVEQKQEVAPVESPVVAPHDEFDDEFAGLEEAATEEDVDGGLDDISSAGGLQTLNESFENINHNDLTEELQGNAFTGTSSVPVAVAEPQGNPASFTQTAPQPPIENAPSPVTNDEWDEIFAGFGNSKQQQDGVAPASIPHSPLPQTPQEQQFVQPQPQHVQPPQQPLSKPPINRGIATTPKALAVEELSGMGFTEEEATAALEKCDWVLEDATNFLLDSA